MMTCSISILKYSSNTHILSTPSTVEWLDQLALWNNFWTAPPKNILLQWHANSKCDVRGGRHYWIRYGCWLNTHGDAFTGGHADVWCSGNLRSLQRQLSSTCEVSQHFQSNGWRIMIFLHKWCHRFIIRPSLASLIHTQNVIFERNIHF